jgi:hypothetical protein
MAVYVDRAQNAYGRMKMSHMLADSVEELHAIADALGLKRKWFQSHSTPHYDICQAKKHRALTLGAVECDRKTVVGLIRRYRAQAAASVDTKPSL